MDKGLGDYFKERKKVEEMMKKMLQKKYDWTTERKSQFEAAWKLYCRAYDKHQILDKLSTELKKYKKKERK